MTEEHDLEAIRQKAPNREQDPRGPDAPYRHKEAERREDQTPDRHARLVKFGAVAPPPIRWVGTNYNFDAGHAVQGIVIHTEVGTNASATGRFQQPNQASAHYGVALDGHEVVQWVAEQNTAWHCGRYYPDASHMGNTNSIGIEHEDNGQYNSPRPDGLYETSARLVAWICQRYGLPINHSTVRGECGHREVSVVGTACPDSLDVDRIIRRANEIANPAPPAPTWKDAFHAEAFTVTLAKPVPLYDLTTGASVGTVPAGTFTAAYRGTFGGKDYRVTAYSFGLGTPHGVLTADVTPVPEWKRNLQPSLDTYRLKTAVPLTNMETGANAGLVAAGPLTVAWATKVGGTEYRMTSYSHDRGVPNGIEQAAIDAAAEKPVPVPPTPVPPTPDPGPPQPPPGAMNWLQMLVDWLKRLFGAK